MPPKVNNMETLELTADILLQAYSIGVFPMAENRDNPDLVWLDPRMRGIIPLCSFHVPRRLRRIVRSNLFNITFNKNFSGVIKNCAEFTACRPKTWINNRIVELYTSLHYRGYGHSVECWENNTLVGGLYGISLKGVFFGESMFNRKDNASKVALVHLATRLSVGGFSFIDTQFITKHLCQFGAYEVPRNEYRGLLAAALKINASIETDYGSKDLEKLFFQ